MDCSLLIHDCFANGIPCSENQLVVGSMYKPIDHGELRAKRQCDDLSSGGSTKGGIWCTRSGGLRNPGGGGWGIEFSFSSRECFPYEKMGITQSLESSP